MVIAGKTAQRFDSASVDAAVGAQRTAPALSMGRRGARSDTPTPVVPRWTAVSASVVTPGTGDESRGRDVAVTRTSNIA